MSGSSFTISRKKPIQEEFLEDYEVKPFESIYCSEKYLSDFSDRSDYDPLAVKKQDDIANAVGFEVKKESTDCDPLAVKNEGVVTNVLGFEVKKEVEVLADNGDAVSHAHNGNAYLSCSKSEGDSKPQEENIVCGSDKQNKLHYLASNAPAVSNNLKNENSQCRSNKKSNPKKTSASNPRFQCSYCEYRCNLKGSFNSHLLTHTSVKPFHCSICDYKCSQKQNLRRHMASHIVDKPYQCCYCEYRCSSEKTLKSHIMIHTGAKQLLCSYCNYKCSGDGNFSRHIFIHTAGTFFQCSYCKYRCTQKGNLESHVVIMHKEITMKNNMSTARDSGSVHISGKEIKDKESVSVEDPGHKVVP